MAGRVHPARAGPAPVQHRAWIDPFATYCHDLEKKFNAGVEVKLELEEGRLLLGKGAERSEGELRSAIEALQARLPGLPA